MTGANEEPAERIITPAELPSLAGMIWSLDSELRDTVARLLSVGGFRIIGMVESASEAIASATTQEVGPDVLVADIAALGITGLPALTAVRDAVPNCKLIVVSPFSGLADAAMEAGAAIVVAPSDLRPLLLFLAELLSEAHAGYPCPCCAPEQAQPRPPAESEIGSSDAQQPEHYQPGVDDPDVGRRRTKPEDS